MYAKVQSSAMLLRYLVLTWLLFLVNLSAQEPSDVTGWENIFQNNRSSVLPLRHYGDKSYYLGYYIKASYLQATQFCKNIHMELLTIRNDEENNRILKFVRDAGKEDAYWTSGAKLLDGHTWIWMSYGLSLEYTKWAPGQPSNDLKHCLQIQSIKGELYFNNEGCDRRAYFICERINEKHISQNGNIGSSTWDNLMQSPSIFPNIGVLYHNNKRYYFASHLKTTFMQAVQFCKLIKMELISITSKDENEKIGKYIRDNNAGNHWWSSGSQLLDGRSWVWFTQGKAIEYTNWKSGEPNSETELCLHLVHSQEKGLEWIDDYCQYEFPVICESAGDSGNGGTGYPGSQGGSKHYTSPTQKINQPTTPTYPEPEAYVPDFDWENTIRQIPPGYITFRHYGGMMYHVEIKLTATQKQAALFCSYHDMQLLEVNDATENRYLERLLLDTGASGPYWTSGRKQGGSWFWSITQEMVSYTNWKKGKPALIEQNKKCIQVDDIAKWSDENCDKRIYFICEARMPSVVPRATYESGQCSQPIVNVYVSTNLLADGQEQILKKETISSKDVGTDGYQVQVNNNIDVTNKEDKNALVFR